MDYTILIYQAILVVYIFAVSLVIAMYATYAERKVAAFMQDRIGPDRAGPFGILQPVADGVKMFMKEEFIPNPSDKILFVVGPCIAMFTACISSAVIPWGDVLTINGHVLSLQVADINVGILYVFGVVSMGVYGIMIGGWASNNKYSMIGAIRASSQLISYEISMGLALISIIMVSGSVSIKTIVEQQQGAHWNVFIQPISFLIFLICAFAETNRTPFDLPECETELIGGFHTEYSSMKLGFYLFAEYINMFVSSAVMASLYFGGYNFPFIHSLGLSPNAVTLIGTTFLFAKIFAFIFFFMWIRWTIPRFRYDQLMKLGWKVLIPLAMLNILITGVVMMMRQ